MTPQEFAVTMKRIAQFWPTFYAKQNQEEIADAWYPLFAKDDAAEVNRAVVICICTLKYPPTVADIKLTMAECRLEDQPTAIEAFQVISEAVAHSGNRNEAIEQYRKLPPILQKLAGSPGQLVSWYKTSEEAFQTVVMSAIRESYTTLAKREAKYYALPAGLQKTEQWRINAPSLDSLPEPQKPRTLADIEAEQDAATAAYREQLGIRPNAAYSEALDAFLAPVTEDEKKLVQLRDEARARRYL